MASKGGPAPFIVLPAPVDLRGKLPTSTASARGYYKRDLAGITGVTIHWTASPCKNGVEAVEAIARAQLKLVASPITGEKFPAIAYSLVVDCRGIVYLCHSLDVRSWHSGAVVNGIARNVSHIGIAIINDDCPPFAQLYGLSEAILWCEQALERELPWEGHKDSFPTACPGPDWGGWSGSLLLALVKLQEGG